MSCTPSGTPSTESSGRFNVGAPIAEDASLYQGVPTGGCPSARPDVGQRDERVDAARERAMQSAEAIASRERRAVIADAELSRSFDVTAHARAHRVGPRLAHGPQRPAQLPGQDVEEEFRRRRRRGFVGLELGVRIGLDDLDAA